MPDSIRNPSSNPEKNNLTFIFGTNANAKPEDESEWTRSLSTQGVAQTEPYLHTFTPAPIPSLPSISVPDYSSQMSHGNQMQEESEKGINRMEAKTKTKTKMPLHEEISGMIGEAKMKEEENRGNASQPQQVFPPNEDLINAFPPHSQQSHSPQPFHTNEDLINAYSPLLRPHIRAQLHTQSLLPEAQRAALRERLVKSAVEIQRGEETLRQMESMKLEKGESLEMGLRRIEKTAVVEMNVPAASQVTAAARQIPATRVAHMNEEVNLDGEGEKSRMPVINVVKTTNPAGSVQEVIRAIPLELLYWQMRPPPFDFEGSVVENPVMRDEFWKGFLDASGRLKEGECVEIRILNPPVGGAEVGMNADFGVRLDEVQKEVETYLRDAEVGGEQNPVKMEAGVEKEKKKRRRPKSKRPAAQKAESESVVDLGRKMEDLHLSPQEQKDPQIVPKDAQVEGGNENGVQNERQSRFREELAVTMTEDQFDAEIDSKMSQICDITIKAVNFNGEPADEAKWTMDILRLLEVSDIALGNVIFPDDGTASLVGEEWGHMKDRVLKLAKLWDEWNKMVKKPNVDILAGELGAMLNVLFEKNIELVKEWLWSRVVRHRWAGLGLGEEYVMEKVVLLDDTVAQENQESDESMEYISPESLISNGSGLLDAKMPDQNVHTAVTNADFPFTTINLIPAPLKLRNSNSHLETHQSPNPNIDSTINLNSRLSNIEHLLQIQLNLNQQPTNHPTVLDEIKYMVQDIKDAIYGQYDPESEDNSDKAYAKKKGLLLLCKQAEEWAEDSKYSTDRVESVLLGDEGEEGLMEISQEIRDDAVNKLGRMEFEKQELLKEVERLQGLLSNSSSEDPVGLGVVEDGGKHTGSVSIQVGHHVDDEEMTKLKMQNEMLKKDLLESRRGRMELVDKMLELDREVEEKDSALMEILWPQGEGIERSVVRMGRYRKGELLGEKKKLAEEAGEENVPPRDLFEFVTDLIFGREMRLAIEAGEKTAWGSGTYVFVRNLLFGRA